MQKLACQYIGCACANNTSKSLISASFGQRPEARGQRPEAREGTKDYKRSCKERINQIFPHHHTVFLMKMQLKITSRNLPKGHSFTPPPNGINPLTKEPGAFGLELQHAAHLPGTKSKKLSSPTIVHLPCLVDSKGSSIQPRLPTYCHDGLLGIQISKEKVHEFFLPQMADEYQMSNY